MYNSYSSFSGISNQLFIAMKITLLDKLINIEILVLSIHLGVDAVSSIIPATESNECFQFWILFFKGYKSLVSTTAPFVDAQVEPRIDWNNFRARLVQTRERVD